MDTRRKEARRPGVGTRATCYILSLAHYQRLFVPICSEPTQRPRTVCERWRESLLEHYGGTPRDDQYVPQCDDLGHFTPLQCHGKSDFCWCVDQDGREVQGTRSQPGTTPACKHEGQPPSPLPGHCQLWVKVGKSAVNRSDGGSRSHVTRIYNLVHPRSQPNVDLSFSFFLFFCVFLPFLFAAPTV